MLAETDWAHILITLGCIWAAVTVLCVVVWLIVFYAISRKI